MGLDAKSLPDAVLRRMSKEDRAAGGKAMTTFDEAQAFKAAREEKELQRQMAGLFRLHGIIANRSAMHKKKTDLPGWPDFVFAFEGRAIACEAKLPGKELDADQVRVRDLMVAAPNCWRYYVVRTYAEAVAMLRELGALK